MEDGRQTIFGLVDDGPTGVATLGFTKPSRGGANSLNALLDAWSLTGGAKYLSLAETLIRRCIHPADDVDELNLLDAESNWSYTMFLTSLAKYARAKEEAEQDDQYYRLATASLVHYGRWMLANERPYLSRPEELEYPTEAWAAQELRKANVFRRVARYASPALARELLAKGDEFGDRAWRDLVGFEKTRATIRSLAIVMTEGLADCVFRDAELSPANVAASDDPVPPRPDFVPQKQRVLAMALRPRSAVRMGAYLLDPRRWRQWRRARTRRTAGDEGDA
jgi:hypothetical protein